jgi:hypothetical protein
MVSVLLLVHVYLFVFEIYYCGTYLCNMLYIDVARYIYVHLLTACYTVQPIISLVSDLVISVDDISAGIFAPSDGQH